MSLPDPAQFDNVDLLGAPIWLSGSVPEPETWNGQPVDRNVQEFARVFAGLVFKYNGRLIHGCHPSITPVLLHQAKRYQNATGSESTSRDKRLKLAVSEFFDSPENRSDWQRWETVAEVEVMPVVEPGEKDAENEATLGLSLSLLRQRMAEQAKAFVAVGGKWWDSEPGRAGIPKEFALAKQRQIPCFILGGFGGISSKYAEENPEWFRTLNNELSDVANQRLAKSTDLTMAAGTVILQLERLLKREG